MNKRDQTYKKGLRLALAFSYPAYKERSCGEYSQKTLKLFEDFLKTGDDSLVNGVLTELKKFNTLMAHLETIANQFTENNGVDFETFDIRVVEAYTVVSKFLNAFGESALQKLLSTLESRGMHKVVVQNYSKKAPRPFIPLHTYYVFMSGLFQFGFSEDMRIGANGCMVKSGVVLEVMPDGKSAKVATSKLVISDQRLELEDFIEKVEINPLLLEDHGAGIKLGDEVAIHQKLVFKKLEKGEAKKLRVKNSEIANLDWSKIVS